MKLIVQIPCFNEEKSIGRVIERIPRKIPGIKSVKILVIDDGSTDKSVQMAKKAGADYVLLNPKNKGLAYTFCKGVEKAIELSADIIVNIDADNQYDPKEIERLVKPIIEQKADLVIGNRRVEVLKHMPPEKKAGNLVGSFLIRRLTNTNVTDASSGFRAFTADMADNITILSTHTYTHEQIIQASFKGYKITEVKIKFSRRKHGQSRLISGVKNHVIKSSVAIIRSILMYKALKYLVSMGTLLFTFGIIGLFRFFYFYVTGEGSGHVQSLIFSSILISIGLNTLLLGVIADLISINRRIIQGK